MNENILTDYILLSQTKKINDKNYYIINSYYNFVTTNSRKYMISACILPFYYEIPNIGDNSKIYIYINEFSNDDNINFQFVATYNNGNIDILNKFVFNRKSVSLASFNLLFLFYKINPKTNTLQEIEVQKLPIIEMILEYEE